MWGGGPSSIAIVDLDGDGNADIAASDGLTNTLSIFRNTGTIGHVSLTLKTYNFTGDKPKIISTGDLDGDGKPDIVAVSQYGAKEELVYKNQSSKGNIDFSGVIQYTTGFSPAGVSIVDMDLDGKADLAVVNQNSNTVSMLRNRVNEPVITSFTPNGTGTDSLVTLRGTRFTYVNAISFGNVPAKSFTVLSDSVMKAVVGNGATGKITIASPYGRATSPAGFTFIPSPLISSFSPATAIKGTVIKITGTGFTNTTAVSFGGTPAASYTVNSATQITAIVGAGASGNVSVKTLGGVAIKSGFAYYNPPGNALAFDGINDNISIPSAVLNNRAAGTYETWVYLNSNMQATILSKQIDDTNSVSIFTIGYYSSSVGQFTTGIPGKVYFRSQNPSPLLSSKATLETGHWYHIAVVFTGSNAKMYINGSLDNTATGNFSIPNYTNPTASIGVWKVAGQAKYLSGRLDETRIWDRGLTQAEIQAGMTAPVANSSPGLIAYYSFDEGADGGNNAGTTSLYDVSGQANNGTLNNFSLSGNTSNWIESYAMVVPKATTATNITHTGFKSNWVAPQTGKAESYLLDVSTSADFLTFVTGYNAKPVTGTSLAVAGLSEGSAYYYRVRAEKASVTGQGGYSNSTAVSTITYPPAISSFAPTKAGKDSAVTIRGSHFTGTTAVSFGGVAARSFTVLSPTSLKAVVATGASGSVSVTNAAGTGTLSGFTFIPAPVINSFTPTSAGIGDTIIVTGTNFTGTKEVSFGNIPAASFSVKSDTEVIAVIGYVASGNVSVTTAGGKGTKNGFKFIPPPPPVITSFLPLSGPVGTTVTITGANFSTVAADNIVYFGAVKAKVTVATDTVITVKVPAGATFEPITLTTNTLTAFSAKPFVVTFNGGGNFIQSSFAPRDDYAVGQYPVAVAIKDLNGDGRPDIGVLNNISNTVSIFKNTSTKHHISFASKQDFSMGVNSNGLCFGDLNGDGKPDVVVSNWSTDAVSVYLNTSSAGTISFGGKTDYPTGRNPTDIAIADLDGNGRPDIVVADHNDGVFTILKNTGVNAGGNIVFRMQQQGSILSTGGEIFAGDLDNDGKPDILESGAWVFAFKNYSTPGNINFQSIGNYTVGTIPGRIVAGDLDGDDKPDVVVSNLYESMFSILRNTSTTGSFSFTSPANYAAAAGWGISIGDLNGDGKVDVIANDAKGVALFKNTSIPGAISFNKKVNYPAGGIISLGDLDGDGKTDIALVGGPGDGSANGTLSLLRNQMGETVVTSFAPENGGKGTTVTIKGTKFTGATSVYFGKIAASSFSVLSDSMITAVVDTGATGDVSVTTALGTSALDGFTFIPAPVITSFSPVTTGPGALVTITGTNFNSATSVSFGGTAAASFVVMADTSIIATIGGGSTGNVEITTPYGTGMLAGFTFSTLPIITSFTPVVAGEGSTVTITGANLAGTTNVAFGGTPAASFTLVSSNTIKAVLGAGATGNVSVTTPQGTATLNGFSFTPLPGITAFSPNIGGPGTSVMISGYNLSGVTTVSFGGTAAASFTVNSASSITAVVGSGATGNVNITTSTGAATLPGFTFTTRPVITSFAPSSGPAGTTVTINGANFSAVAADNVVYFGTAKATVTAATPASLTVTAPPGATYKPITVTTRNLTAYSEKPFSITFAGSGPFTAGSFAAITKISGYVNVTDVAAVDLNSDGKIDMITPGDGSVMLVFRNTGGAQKISFHQDSHDDFTNCWGSNISVGDFNGDGKLDFVYAQNGYDYNSGGQCAFTVFTNTTTATGIHTVHSLQYPDNGVSDVAVRDIDGDGKPDLACTDNSNNRIAIYRNTSEQNTAFAPKLNFASGVGPVGIAIGDMDGDGKPDIVTANSKSNTISIFRNVSTSGSISFAAALSYITGSGPTAIAVGDLDGDGKPDILVTNSLANTISIFRNTSAGGVISFETKVSYATGANPVKVALGDLDGDGKADIAVANKDDNSVSVFRNTSVAGIPFTSASFDKKMDYRSGSGGAVSIAIADFDGDGKPDIAVPCYNDIDVSILRNQIGEIHFAGLQANVLKNTDGIAGISLFPNPTTEYVMVTYPSTEKPAQITMMDMLGRRIKTITTNNNTTQTKVEVKNLAKGVYHLVWSNGIVAYTKILVIQ